MVDVGTCFSLRDYIRYMNFENDLLSVALEVVSNANSITQLFFFLLLNCMKLFLQREVNKGGPSDGKRVLTIDSHDVYKQSIFKSCILFRSRY